MSWQNAVRQVCGSLNETTINCHLYHFREEKKRTKGLSYESRWSIKAYLEWIQHWKPMTENQFVDIPYDNHFFSFFPTFRAWNWCFKSRNSMKLICAVSTSFDLFREHFHTCICSISLFRLPFVSSFLNEISFAYFPLNTIDHHVFLFICKFYLRSLFHMLQYSPLRYTSIFPLYGNSLYKCFHCNYYVFTLCCCTNLKFFLF